MAVIFRGNCAACGFSSPFISGEWLGVRLRSGTVEVLPHPLEDERLRELGFTWEEAKREQRLHYYVSVACLSCSHIGDVDARDRRLPALKTTWSEALMFGFGFVVVAAAVAWALFGHREIALGWRILMIPGYVVMAFIFYLYMTAALGKGILRYRRPRAQPLPPSGIPCDQCPSGRLFPIGLIAERILACPACATPSYVLHHAGIS